MSLIYLQQGNVKKSKKMMKWANIDEENLHVLLTTRGILMKFSRTISLMILLKATKKQGCTSI